MSIFSGAERGVARINRAIHLALLVILVSIIGAVVAGVISYKNQQLDWSKNDWKKIEFYGLRRVGVGWNSYFLQVNAVPHPRWVTTPHRLDYWITREYQKKYKVAVSQIGAGAMAGSFLFSMLFLIYLAKNGKADDKFRRGSKLLSAKELKGHIEKEKRVSKNCIKIGDVPIPEGDEFKHITATGTTGAGKSQLVQSLLRQARVQGDKVLVFDPGAEFLSGFYKNGDIILNPFDERSVYWSPLNEIDNPMDADALAHSAIQPSAGDATGSSYFYEGGRAIMSVILGLMKTGQLKDDIADVFCSSTVADFQRHLFGTKAYNYVDPQAKGQGSGGVLSTIITRIEKWSYLAEVPNTNPFSIRKWIKNEDDNSWLWLTSIESEQISLEGMISTWIDIAARQILSREPRQGRRIWIVIDELASLQKLPALLRLLSMGRKYRAVVVLGTQSPAQLELIYKKEGLRVIEDTTGTRCAFRLENAESLEAASKMFGEHEFLRENENDNTGKMRGKAFSEQVTKERIIMPSEIQTLPDLHHYLRLAGGLPVAKLKLPYVPSKKVTERIIPREITFKTPVTGVSLEDF